MPGIYHETDQIIRRAGDGRLLFMVSLGRDTACFLDLFSRRTELSRHAFVHYTAYETMLPYQARHLAYLEKRYGISVEVRPDPRSLSAGLAGVAEERDMLLDRHGCCLQVLGYRMDESLQRRGMLKSLTDGISDKLRECYPLRSWTPRITDAYVKSNKILLAPEYSWGFRDCRNHRGLKAVLLHDMSYEDYVAAVKQDPHIEVDYVRYRKRLSKPSSDVQDGENDAIDADGGALQPQEDI